MSGTDHSYIEAEANLAIGNALAAEIKEKYGDGVTRRHTIVLTLLEWERQEGDGPQTPRVQLSIKTLEPIPAKTAAKTLERASLQFRRQALKEQEQ